MRGFVNPYNFIKFPREKALAYKEEDRHSGVIRYTITTKTPLFIPNSSSDCAFRQSDNVKGHKSYDFFSYTDLDDGKRYDNEYHIPVIPGSEMRGVVRNVYETLTDSCMGILNTEEYPVKRSMEKFNPALICREQNGTFSLYDARSLRIGEAASEGRLPEGFETYSNGTLIYYQEPDKNNKGHLKTIEEYCVKPRVYPRKGYLLKWGMGVKKKRYHVFVMKRGQSSDGKVQGIQLSKDTIERKLIRVIDHYLSEPTIQSDNKAAYEEYKKDVENFLQGKGGTYFPVNYSKLDKGIYYLAPATYTKEVSDNNLGKLAGKFAPCEKEHCPACDMFGYVGKNNEACKGSKVRFTDMYVVDEKEDVRSYYASGKPVTIQALGEPKLGNVEFYLKKPKGASFWTYDYYIPQGQKEVVADGELRGRKYYWHHRKVNLHEEIEATKLNKTIRPVRENIKFSGELYFEGISAKQMNQLIWILNSGSENLGLKLGGAKPLGYGSISCSVDEVIERTIEIVDRKLTYNVKPISIEAVTYENAGLSKDVKAEFYKIAGLDSVPEDVEITYPKDKEQKDKPLTQGYSWFVNNHKTLSGRMARGRADVKIERALPEILDEDFSMEYNEKQQRNSNSSNYKGKRTGQQNQRRTQGDKRPHYQNGRDRRR